MQKAWGGKCFSLLNSILTCYTDVSSAALGISKVLCDFTFFPLRPRGTGIDRPGEVDTLKTWIEKNPWTWKGLGNLEQDKKQRLDNHLNDSAILLSCHFQQG